MFILALCLVEVSRRLFLVSPAIAKVGDGARIGFADPSEADAILGARADPYGENSRQNSVYQKNLQIDDEKTILQKREELREVGERLDKSVGLSLEKKQWPKVVDGLNREMFRFKGLLSDVTKARQFGKVCLVDKSQRGGIPKGYDPEDCPLQLVQVSVLQDVNSLFQIASTTRDSKKANDVYAKFQYDLGNFLDQSAAATSSNNNSDAQQRPRADLAF